MNVGFKEWALICEALGDGRQSVILRKGGIAEGRDGFRFKHAEFLLMPTLFHEQIAKLKLPPQSALPVFELGQHRILFRTVVEWTRELTDWAQVCRLDALHLWAEPVIRERFLYDGKQSVSLAFVRVYRLRNAFVFPDTPAYGGCRSWVTLPDFLESGEAEPILTEEQHRQRERDLLEALD